MKISPRIAEILTNSSYEQDTLRLPAKLDRADYLAVAEALEAMDCKWNKKRKAMAFADQADAFLIVQAALAEGAVIHAKDDFDFYPTPSELADQIIEMAGITPGMSVLEPSAGHGALAVPAIKRGAQVTCHEILPQNIATLSDELLAAAGSLKFSIHQVDFLATTPSPTFDRVIMNPPFTKRADIEHVLHAYKFLAPGGRLVAIMSAGVMFRGDMKSVRFRDLVTTHGGSIAPLPEGSFKAAGTSVNTAVVTINAAAISKPYGVTRHRVRLSKKFMESRASA